MQCYTWFYCYIIASKVKKPNSKGVLYLDASIMLPHQLQMEEFVEIFNKIYRSQVKVNELVKYETSYRT